MAKKTLRNRLAQDTTLINLHAMKKRLTAAEVQIRMLYRILYRHIKRIDQVAVAVRKLS